MRWLLPVLVVLAVVTTLPASQAASVEVVEVDHPDLVVYDRNYPVNVTVRNDGDQAAQVRLFSHLYRPSDEPCGPAAGDDHRGQASRRDVPLEVPAHGTATYPGERDTPWWHRVNASNQVGDGGTFEVCVFAYDPQGTTAEERYLDHGVVEMELRMTNEAPDGSFTVDPSLGTTDTTFRFEAQASDPEGDPVSYRWDFHDVTAAGRAVASGPTAAHAFYPPGVYMVNLTLSDGWDHRTLQRDVTVCPPDEPPEDTVCAERGASSLPTPGPGILGGLAALAAAGAAAALRSDRR